jgi:tetratricopeptide (TPR) repeat protein
MSLQGDLSILELGDLIQNLETHERSGILSVECQKGPVHLYFRDGRLTLFSRPGRASLMSVLLASGAVSSAAMEAATKKRRRTRKSLGEVLVATGAIEEDALVDVAASRLLDEACELIAVGGGAFTFTQGKLPRGVFDPEERRLNLSLPAGPLLLEAARREDHWKMIRARVPSDSMHYVVQRKPAQCSPLAERMLELLDGTRSVAEVMTSFPHRRFEAYQQLADLVEGHVLRVVEPGDMAGLVKDLARHDQERAWTVISRGLEAHPQNVELLAEQAVLAEGLGFKDDALDALKLLVHVHTESGERAAASDELERARALHPESTWILERTLAMAVEEGRLEDARRDGLQLAALYQKPGLHKKTCKVLETLLALQPDDCELHLELARAQADCEDLEAAFKTLDKRARRLLAAEDYQRAEALYHEALALDPANKEAQARLAAIQSGRLERRRARVRRVVRSVLAGVIAALLLAVAGFEIAARISFRRASRAVSEAELVESGRYDQAIRIYEQVQSAYPMTSTALLDVRGVIAELEAKLWTEHEGE